MLVINYTSDIGISISGISYLVITEKLAIMLVEMNNSIQGMFPLFY